MRAGLTKKGGVCEKGGGCREEGRRELPDLSSKATENVMMVTIFPTVYVVDRAW
jgi:hypothetical protein